MRHPERSKIMRKNNFGSKKRSRSKPVVKGRNNRDGSKERKSRESGQSGLHSPINKRDKARNKKEEIS